MACMARVRMDFDPTAIRCYAFGAPPVLSLSEKTSAQNVMSVRTLHCSAKAPDQISKNAVPSASRGQPCHGTLQRA